MFRTLRRSRRATEPTPAIFRAPAILLVVAGCSSGGDADSGPVVEGDPIGVEGAHEHDVVRMGFAVDPSRLTLDLRAPADAVFGFEHTPSNDEEREIARQALTRLRENAGSAVVIPEELRCAVESVEVVEAPEGEHDEDAGHDEGAEHDEADEHDDHGADAAEHSEVRLTVVWSCDTSPEGTLGALTLRAVLPAAELVDLTVITSQGQAGGRVAADATFRF